jgi:hypothetical protein
MTTQFPDAVSNSNTTLAPTATRVTPAPARPFSSVLQAGASAVVDGAEAAAQRLPGGPLVSAALRPGFRSSAVSGSLGTPTVSGSLGTPTEAVPLDASASSTVDAGGDPMAVIQAQSDNALYFLRLQQRIQDENRTYSTLSNVLKARHETMKNAISNLR